jgi:hypothetical protein
MDNQSMDQKQKGKYRVSTEIKSQLEKKYKEKARRRKESLAELQKTKLKSENLVKVEEALGEVTKFP